MNTRSFDGRALSSPWVFAAALSIRLLIIGLTPSSNTMADLVMYRDTGQLVAHGVNPYDPLDQIALRDRIRAADAPFNAAAASATSWNYYASGNLPLSALLFGAIETVAPGRPAAYRVTFAVLDSLLAVCLVVYARRFWRGRVPSWLVLGIGTASPVLLYWGAILPEDKGTQTLLMIGALYFAQRRALWPAAMCLGASVAFKGLGAFIAPFCLLPFWQGDRPGDTRPVRAAAFVLLSAACCLVFFLPYVPDVITVILRRASHSVSSLPRGASIWRALYVSTTSQWTIVRDAFVAGFIALNVYGAATRRFSPAVLTASVVLLGTAILMLDASLDRLNIGLVVAIVLVGQQSASAAAWLGGYYCVGGYLLLFSVVALKAFTKTQIEMQFLDSLFSLAFVLAYCGVLAALLRRGHPAPSGPLAV